MGKRRALCLASRKWHLVGRHQIIQQTLTLVDSTASRSAKAARRLVARVTSTTSGVALRAQIDADPASEHRRAKGARYTNWAFLWGGRACGAAAHAILSGRLTRL